MKDEPGFHVVQLRRDSFGFRREGMEGNAFRHRGAHSDREVDVCKGRISLGNELPYFHLLSRGEVILI